MSTPQQFSQALKEKRAVVFIGPEATAPLGIPNPADFIRSSLELFEAKMSESDHLNVAAWLQKNDWRRVAECYQRVDPERFEQLVGKTFRSKGIARDARLPYYLRIIAAIQPQRIFTTVVDNALVDLFPDHKVFTWLDSPHFDHLRAADAQPHILYLDGHAALPESLTFSHSLHQDQEGSAGEAQREYLKICLQRDRFVFVGFDPEDDSLKNVAALAHNTGISPPWSLLCDHVPPTDRSLWPIPAGSEPGTDVSDQTAPDRLAQWWAEVARELEVTLPEPMLTQAKSPKSWVLRTVRFQHKLAKPTQEQVQAYYHGHSPDWAIVAHGHTLRRDETKEVLSLIESKKRGILILGAGGEGKSTVLKQVGLDLSHQGYQLLEVHNPRMDVTNLLARQRGRVALLMSEADRCPNLPQLLHQLEEQKQALVILAARPHEWHHALRNHPLYERIPRVELGPITHAQAKDLADLLHRANLAKDPDALAKRLQKNTGRLLFAAMLEATAGTDLKAILADVVDNIASWAGGRQLLDALALVCSIETLPSGPFFCDKTLFQSFLGIDQEHIPSLCEKLEGEVRLKTHGTSIRSRHKIIAEALHKALFRREKAPLNERTFNERILETCSELLAMNPNGRERPLLGAIPNRYIRERRYADAEYLLKVATTIDPYNAYIWQMWALLARDMGRIGSLDEAYSARWLFHKATEVGPHDAAAWQAWAMLEEELGNIGDEHTINSARWLFTRAVTADASNSPSWHAWALMEYRQGNKPLALELLMSGLKHAGQREEVEKFLHLKRGFDAGREFPLKRRIPKTETEPELESKHKPQTGYAAYEHALKCSEQPYLTSDEVLAALQAITPYLEAPVLEGDQLSEIDNAPVCMIALDVVEAVGQARERQTRLFLADIGGCLHSFPIATSGPVAATRHFQIPDFNPIRDRVLGLYRLKTPFRKDPDLLLVFQQNDRARGYHFGLGQPNLRESLAEPQLLDQIPPWMQICPVDLPKEQRLEELDLKIPIHAKAAALWCEQTLIISREPRNDDLMGDSIITAGNLILTTRTNQTIFAYNSPDEAPIWHWHTRKQVMCILGLPSHPDQLILAQEDGRIVRAHIVGRLWGDRLTRQLSDRVIGDHGLETPAQFLAWVKHFFDHRLPKWPEHEIAPKVAVLRILLDHLLSRDTPDNSPLEQSLLDEAGKLYHDLYRQREFLYIMPRIRREIRKWFPYEKDNGIGRIDGARFIYHLYSHLPYQLQDMVDLEIQRHLRSKQGFTGPTDIEVDDRYKDYQALIEASLTNSDELLAKDTTPHDRCLALLAERVSDRYTLITTTRADLGDWDGVLRRAPNGRLLWVLEKSVYFQDPKKTRYWPAEFSLSFKPRFAVSIGKNEPISAFLTNRDHWALIFFDGDYFALQTSKPWDRERNLVHVASAGDDLILLVSLNPPGDGGGILLELWSFREEKTLASRTVSLNAPSELAVKRLDTNRWIMVSNVHPAGIELDYFSIEGDQLITANSVHRELEGRVRSLYCLEKSPLVLVGTTAGYLYALSHEDETCLDIVWSCFLGGSIRHLDAVEEDGITQIMALTSTEEVIVVDGQGNPLWYRRVYTTFRSGTFFRHAGALHLAVSDARGALALFRQSADDALDHLMDPPLRERSRKPVHREEEVLPALKDLTKVQPGLLRRKWSISARLLLVQGLIRGLEQHPEETWAALERLLPRLNALEMFRLAAIQQCPPISLIEKMIAQIIARQGSRHTMQLSSLVRLLQDLVLNLGREALNAEALKEPDHPWHGLSREARQHPAVTAAILSKTELTGVRSIRFSQLIEAATFLGPHAFSALPLVVPTRKLGLTRWLAAAIEVLGHSYVSLEAPWKADFEELSYNKPVRILIETLRLLTHQPDWHEVEEVARQANAIDCSGFHPGLNYLLKLLAPLHLPEHYHHLPIKNQLSLLYDHESRDFPALPENAGPWQGWLQSARGRLNHLRHQTIATYRAELQALFRVRLEDPVIRRLDQHKALLTGRLEREGIPHGRAQVTLRFAKGGIWQPKQGTYRHTWSWEQVPPTLQLEGKVNGDGAISVETITQVGVETINTDAWKIPLPAMNPEAQGLLLRHPQLVDRLMEKLPRRAGLHLLAYDERLGLAPLLRKLNETGYKLIDLDALMKDRGSGRANPMGFHAEAILTAMGVELEGKKRRVAPSRARQGIALHPGTETAQRLLQPEHDAVLKRLAQLIEDLTGLPLCWLLPKEFALKLQSKIQRANFRPLYRLDQLEEAETESLIDWLAEGKGVPKGEIARILDLCGGHLQLIQRWREHPVDPEEWLLDDEVHRLLRQEVGGLSNVQYANLILLAHAVIPLPGKQWPPGLIPANKTEEAGGPFVRAMLLGNDYPKMPDQVTKLLSLGSQADQDIRERCRNLLAIRGLLVRSARLFYLRQPYLAWLEQQTSKRSSAWALLENLMGSDLMTGLDLSTLAGARDDLSGVIPELGPRARKLIAAVDALQKGRVEHTNLKKVLSALAGFPQNPITISKDHPVKAPIEEELGRLRIYSLPSKEDEQGHTFWFAVLRHAPPAGPEALEDMSWEEPITLLLMGPGIRGLASIKNPRIVVLDDPMLKEVFTAPNPAEAFRLLLRNRAGLMRYSPYQVGNALPKDAQTFVGRKREQSAILQNIASHSALILGGRQIGKTSLLRKLQAQLEQDETRRVVYVDGQGIQDGEEFIEYLTEAFAEQRLSWIPSHNPIQALVKTCRHHQPLTILINEADGIALGAPKLLSHLRALSEEKTAQFIFAGYQVAYRATRDNKHPFYHWVKVEQEKGAFILGALSEPSSKKLVDLLETSDLSLRWESEQTKQAATALLLDRTHRIPILLQGACRRLVQRLDQAGRGVIRNEDLNIMKDHFPAWDYLSNIRISLEAGHLKTGMMMPLDEEYWGKLILAAIVSKAYPHFSEQDANSIRKNRDHKNSLSVGEIVVAIDTLLETYEHNALRHRVKARFKTKDYQQILDLWTLTVLLSIHPHKTATYFFQDHIYPLELHGFLSREQMTLENYINQQLRNLDYVMSEENVTSDI